MRPEPAPIDSCCESDGVDKRCMPGCCHHAPGSIEWVTKRMVSVETVRFCTGDVRSKEDRPIFSVPVARATAHRGGDGVEFPAAFY